MKVYIYSGGNYKQTWGDNQPDYRVVIREPSNPETIQYGYFRGQRLDLNILRKFSLHLGFFAKMFFNYFKKHFLTKLNKIICQFNVSCSTQNFII